MEDLHEFFHQVCFCEAQQFSFLKPQMGVVNSIFVKKSLYYSTSSNKITHQTLARSSHRRFYIREALLTNFPIFTGKHLSWSLFLIKLQSFRSATLLKRDPNTGVFLWVLQNFSEHLFWRTSANDCFCLGFFDVHIA